MQQRPQLSGSLVGPGSSSAHDFLDGAGAGGQQAAGEEGEGRGEEEEQEDDLLRLLLADEVGQGHTWSRLVTYVAHEVGHGQTWSNPVTHVADLCVGVRAHVRERGCAQRLCIV